MARDFEPDYTEVMRGICDHENLKDPAVKQDATNFAVVMDLTENCMYLAPGSPVRMHLKNTTLMFERTKAWATC